MIVFRSYRKKEGELIRRYYLTLIGCRMQVKFCKSDLRFLVIGEESRRRLLGWALVKVFYFNAEGPVITRIYVLARCMSP